MLNVRSRIPRGLCLGVLNIILMAGSFCTYLPKSCPDFFFPRLSLWLQASHYMFQMHKMAIMHNLMLVTKSIKAWTSLSLIASASPFYTKIITLSATQTESFGSHHQCTLVLRELLINWSCLWFVLCTMDDDKRNLLF